MSSKNRARLNLEQLPDRITPTTAVLSNGMLLIQGDNLGNNINVFADSSGNIHVTERGQAVAISGPAANLTDVQLIVERAGTGNNNTLATDPSLTAISDELFGNGGGVMTFNPGNNAPSTAYGSPNTTAVNHFIANPGGKDTFTGGKGYNLFDWEPGTGTDIFIGAGKLNQVVVVGNNAGVAENDSLTADGNGGATYTRTNYNNLTAFNLYTTGIQDWYIEPSTGTGNTVTIGDLTGTKTKRVEVDAGNSTVNAGAQQNADVRLVVNGVANAITQGAGPTHTENVTVPTAADLVNALVTLSQQS